MTNPTNDPRDSGRPAFRYEPPRSYESESESALRYARTEQLPEEKIQEVLRSPYSTPSDLRRAADNYNDD
jgi:hypothetical protein